jgi:hypothetical protein
VSLQGLHEDLIVSHMHSVSAACKTRASLNLPTPGAAPCRALGEARAAAIALETLPGSGHLLAGSNLGSVTMGKSSSLPLGIAKARARCMSSYMLPGQEYVVTTRQAARVHGLIGETVRYAILAGSC